MCFNNLYCSIKTNLVSWHLQNVSSWRTGIQTCILVDMHVICLEVIQAAIWVICWPSACMLARCPKGHHAWWHCSSGVPCWQLAMLWCTILASALRYRTSSLLWTWGVCIISTCKNPGLAGLCGKHAASSWYDIYQSSPSKGSTRATYCLRLDNVRSSRNGWGMQRPFASNMHQYPTIVTGWAAHTLHNGASLFFNQIIDSMKGYNENLLPWWPFHFIYH